MLTFMSRSFNGTYGFLRFTFEDKGLSVHGTLFRFVPVPLCLHKRHRGFPCCNRFESQDGNGAVAHIMWPLHQSVIALSAPGHFYGQVFSINKCPDTCSHKRLLPDGLGAMTNGCATLLTVLLAHSSAGSG